MQQIPSPISSRFDKFSKYDLLRNELVGILGKIDINNINNILVTDIKFQRVIDRLAFYYILKKLVTLVKHHEGIDIYINGSLGISEENLKNKIKLYFNFDDNELDSITKLLLKLVRETKSNHIKSTVHKNELNNSSFDNDYRCYICGSIVDYIDPNDESYRTIEHFQPRSFGGNKHQKNLFIACKRCNEVKSDLLTWLEKNIFSIHSTYINHEEGLPQYCDDELIPLYIEEKFEKFISDEIIFIVTSMYNYKCSICNTDNDISDETYIIEKEPDDYFHIQNLMTACNLCLKEIDNTLLNQDIYIKRKRITNDN